MHRREDQRLLTGFGQFIENHTPAHCAYGVVLRSPIAHGRITSMDVEGARAAPGVLDILTNSELEQSGIGPLRCRLPVTSRDGSAMIEPTRPILANGWVKYVGHPIAFVVAETEAAALDALDLIDVDYEDAPVIANPEVAVADGAEAIWPEASDNVSFTWELGLPEATRDAISGAAHVVRLRVPHPRIAISPVETRGAVGEFDPTTERFTLHTPSQGVVMLRTAMAEMFGIEESAVRVVTEDVGGSFAVKIWPYPEHVLCLEAARRTKRPVKWIASRTESFIADAHGRARVDQATLALDEHGRFLAFHIDALSDLGAFVNPVGASTATQGACRTFGHSYKIPTMHYEVRGVFTNAIPVDAYRGAGKPESTGTMERIIDFAAAKLGFDRLDLRRMNLVRPDDIPYPTPMNETYDSGDFPAILESALTKADYAGFPNRRQESESRGRLRGVGITMHMHASGGSTAERINIIALPDGTVRVRSGAQDTGQGHQTALAQVAAEALGLTSDRIVVEQGDSDVLVKGGGSGGSNLMPVSANTLHRAALEMIETSKAIAGHVLEAAAPDIEYEAGTFRIAGTDRQISFAELAARFPEIPADALEPGLRAGCVGETDFEGIHTTFPNGACVVEVEVDPETGGTTVERFTSIDDLGRIIDPGSARGQIQGGFAQGMGEALMEGVVFDPETGQPVNGSMMDYALPRATDLPNLDLDWAATGSPNSLLGVKGAGELSSNGGNAPFANAVIDALAPLGVTHIDKPLTPEKVWRAIQTAK